METKQSNLLRHTFDSVRHHVRGTQLQSPDIGTRLRYEDTDEGGEGGNITHIYSRQG